MAGMRAYHRNDTFITATMLVNGQEVAINPTQSYVVVTTDYVRGGGDGYTQLAAGKVLLRGGVPTTELVANDIRATPEGITPTTEGRIVNCATVDCTATQLAARTREVCCARK